MSPDSHLVRTAREVPTIVVGEGSAGLIEAGCEVIASGNIAELLDELGKRRFANILVEGMLRGTVVSPDLEKALPASPPESPAGGPSAYDLMKEGFGCVRSGVPDLATNPKHMEGFGECRK